MRARTLCSIVLFATLALSAETVPAQTWTTAAPMPTARFDLAAGVIDGKLYAVGGLGGVFSSVLNTLEVYDPATNTWTTKTGMPTPRLKLATAVIEGKLYAVGGWNNNSVLNALEVYDPATNTWATKAAMPTAREALAAGAINGKLYVVGGQDGNNLVNTLEVYDPATDTWATKTGMPTARDLLAASVIDGKLYAVGGYAWSYINPLEVYDPVTDAWETKTGMPTARAYLATGVIDGKLYAVGGNNGSNPVNTLEVYNPAANTWETRTGMPTPRFSLAAGVIGGKLYSVGGHNGSSLLNTLEVYGVAGTITTTAWTAANSPYRVTGTVTIPPGNTLTIEPGVEVLFDADVAFNVSGTIIAVGTAQDSIRFAPGTSAAWRGIRITGNGNPASKFSYTSLSGVLVPPTSADGGAFFLDGAVSLEIQNSSITGCTAWKGSTLFMQNGATVLIENSTMRGNRQTTPGTSGGTLVNNGGNLTVRGCVIDDCDAISGGVGGAIWAANSSAFTTVERTLITGCYATFGGAFASYSIATTTFNNCTLSGNSAQSSGSGHAIYYQSGYLTLNNCIVWDNNIILQQAGAVTITYSDVQGGWTGTGTGNINADPLFVNAAAGDFNLQPGSPCIDAGDPTSPPDADGTRADMGVFARLATTASGTVNTTTWLKSSSPYRITGTVTVPTGSTLTIEPGVDVLFDADVQFIVNGALVAVGTSQDSIRFLKGTASEWGGIRITGPQASAFAYTRISDGHADGVTDPDDRGGGMFLGGNASVTLDHCVFSENRANDSGGGFYTDGNFVAGAPSVTMNNCTFTNNTAIWGGGFVAGWYSTATVNTSVFSGNNAIDQGNGGGVAVWYSTATFNNCLVANNSAQLGGGLYNAGTGLTMTHCTVANNTSPAGSGLYILSGGTATLKNSIFWWNSPSEQIGVLSGSVTANYCDIQGEYFGGGDNNISDDPFFVDVANGDYRLLAGSPCIDTGDPASPLDPDGTRADMGAFSTFHDRLTLPNVAAYPGEWVEGVVTGVVESAVGVNLAFLVDTTVVDSVKVLDSPYSDREVNIYGDTVFVGLSNATALAIGGGDVARLQFRLTASATPRVAALAWVPFPETTVNEGPATLTNGSVQVLNRLPVWSARGDTTANPTMGLVFTVGATDADGQGLTYDMPISPRNATFETDTRTFTLYAYFDQVGDTVVVFSVNDGYDTVLDTVNISVLDYYGDITLDGTISALDASKALQYSVHLMTEITVEVGDVSDNGAVTAYDAGLILYKVIHSEFIFPVRAVGTKYTKPVQTAPRSLAFVPDGDGWNLIVSDPDGILGCDLTLSVPEGANPAFSSDGAFEYAVDGQTVRVGIAWADFTNPVLLHVAGALPVIQAASLNEGAMPSMLSAPVPFSLAQNTPNPFNPTTTIRYSLPEAGAVQLIVFSATGQLIRTLVDGRVAAGSHNIVWDGRDAIGRDVASGLYFYRIVTAKSIAVRRMTLLR